MDDETWRHQPPYPWPRPGTDEGMTPYPARPSPPPRRASRVPAVTLGVCGAIVVALVLGVAALVARGVDETKDAIESAPTTYFGDWIEVELGRRFTAEGFRFDEGWRVYSNREFRSSTVVDLRASTRSGGRLVSVELDFELGPETSIETSCVPSPEQPVADAVALTCSPTSSLVRDVTSVSARLIWETP